MNKEQKRELLEELQNDPYYSQVIQVITNQEEKRQVKTFTEEIYLSLIDSFTKVIDSLEGKE